MLQGEPRAEEEVRAGFEISHPRQCERIRVIGVGRGQTERFRLERPIFFLGQEEIRCVVESLGGTEVIRKRPADHRVGGHFAGRFPERHRKRAIVKECCSSRIIGQTAAESEKVSGVRSEDDRAYRLAVTGAFFGAIAQREAEFEVTDAVVDAFGCELVAIVVSTRPRVIGIWEGTSPCGFGQHRSVKSFADLDQRYGGPVGVGGWLPEQRVEAGVGFEVKRRFARQVRPAENDQSGPIRSGFLDRSDRCFRFDGKILEWLVVGQNGNRSRGT